MDTLNFEQGVPLRQELETKWSQLAQKPGILRYQLNVVATKRLVGKFNFLSQLNPDRTTKRRPPQTIATMSPTFNETQFNFNKINPDELMFKVIHKDCIMTFLVNNSPLTLNHSLICPNLTSNQAQILTQSSVEYGIELLRNLGDRSYRVGYNSPGAWASVNHLHLHVLQVQEQLYVESVPIIHIRRNLHKIDSENSPTNGFVFRARISDSANEVAAEVMTLVRYLSRNEIAHNLLFSRGFWADTDPDELRVFVFPRNQMSAAKEFSSFNVAFCELSGYVPVGEKQIFDDLTEDQVVAKIKRDIGNICEDILDEITALFAD